MLRRAKPILLGAALLAGVAAPAAAADFYEPPVVEAPPVYYQPQPEPAPAFGGWYIRGDIDYHKLGWRGGDYILYTGPASGTTGSFDTGDIRGSFSLGGGIGFQASKHFRFDLTGDYFFRSAFRGTFPVLGAAHLALFTRAGLCNAVGYEIDRIQSAHILLLEKIGSMALARGENGDEHIGPGHFLAAG